MWFAVPPGRPSIGRIGKQTRKWLGALIVGLLLIPSALSPNLTYSKAMMPASEANSSTEGEIREFRLLSPQVGWVLVGQNLYWTTDSGQTWRDIAPHTANTTVDAAYFLDTRQGWVLLEGNNDPSSPTFSVARTADGGSTWNIRPLPSATPSDANSLTGVAHLYFLNAQMGWLVIKRATSSNFDMGVLFGTTDGGDTWTQLSAPVGDPVYFTDSKTGWTAGGPSDTKLYRTQDGGISWTQQQVDPSLQQSSNTIVGLPEFSNKLNGILPIIADDAAGTRVALYTTADGGQHWQSTASNTLGHRIEAGVRLPSSAVDSQTLFMLQPNSGHILKLSNHNVSALDSAAQVLTEVVALDMVTIDRGWGEYQDSSCNAGYCSVRTGLTSTSDGGRTWQVLRLPSSTPVIATTTGSPGGIANSSQTFAGQGFDTCQAPSLSALASWVTNGPYRVVNLYIGGSDRGCSNSSLTASYIAQASQQGWQFIPTWVGPQAPCWSGSSAHMSSDPTTAYNEGVSEGSSATNTAAALGFSSSTIVYYDMEAYNTADTTCRNAVDSFISGWVSALHGSGNKAGAYGSSCGSAISDFADISNVPDGIWPAAWIYTAYNSNATVWGVSCLSDGLFSNHQRIRQYAGGHNEAWGGTTLNIDSDVIDGIVASLTNSPLPTNTPTPQPQTTNTPLPTATLTPTATATTAAYCTPPSSPAGVYLFTQPNYCGSPLFLTSNDSSFDSTFNDNVWSVHLVGPYSVTLYRDPNYSGVAQTITSDVSNLGNSTIGSTASSAQVTQSSCNSTAQGVTIFSSANYNGACDTLTSSISDLSTLSPSMNDAVQSIIIHGPYKATLYADPNYSGTSVAITHTTGDLAQSPIGYGASSIQISVENCDPSSGGVSLYAEQNYDGICTTLTSDTSSLSGDFNDNVYSVRLTSGYSGTLYRDPGFSGVSQPVTTDIPDTTTLTIGNTTSSVQVVAPPTATPTSTPTPTPATLRVPQDYPTIGQALAVAHAGQTVLVSPGTYNEEVTVPAGVSLQGSNQTTTIIDGGGVDGRAVVYLESGATLSGFTIQHSGNDFWDAGVWMVGPGTISNNRIMGNSMGIVYHCSTSSCNDQVVVTYDLVAHSTATGIQITGTLAIIRNNTVVDNHLNGIATDYGANATIQLNIVTNSGNDGINTTSAAAVTLQDNVFWQNVIDYNSGTPSGTGDIDADPLFVDPTNNDFRVYANSPAASLGAGAYPAIPITTTPTPTRTATATVIATPIGTMTPTATPALATHRVYIPLVENAPP